MIAAPIKFAVNQKSGKAIIRENVQASKNEILIVIFRSIKVTNNHFRPN
jgi:hypothetical protein